MEFITLMATKEWQAKKYSNCSIWPILEDTNEFVQVKKLYTRIAKFLNSIDYLKHDNSIFYDTNSIITDGTKVKLGILIKFDTGAINPHELKGIVELARELITKSIDTYDEIQNSKDVPPEQVKLIVANGKSLPNISGLITATKHIADLTNIFRDHFPTSNKDKINLEIDGVKREVISNKKTSPMLDKADIEYRIARIYCVCDHTLTTKVSSEGYKLIEASYKSETRDQLLDAQMSRSSVLVGITQKYIWQKGSMRSEKYSVVSIAPEPQNKLNI